MQRASTFNSFMTKCRTLYPGIYQSKRNRGLSTQNTAVHHQRGRSGLDKRDRVGIVALAVELNILQRILVSHFDDTG